MCKDRGGAGEEGEQGAERRRKGEREAKERGRRVIIRDGVYKSTRVLGGRMTDGHLDYTYTAPTRADMSVPTCRATGKHPTLPFKRCTAM